jgi:hypothetical protein
MLKHGALNKNFSFRLSTNRRQYCLGKARKRMSTAIVVNEIGEPLTDELEEIFCEHNVLRLAAKCRCSSSGIRRKLKRI